MNQTLHNPLAGFMRQPKLYIKLPSNGEFWPEGSLEKTETGDYPVYSMTAKDELLLKVPDALMNGQAIVDVLQSCVPSIKNAWHTPNIDLDALLIAIRVATYGEHMKVPLNDSDLDVEYEVNLTNVLSQLQNQINWDPVVPISAEITVFVKPSNYKQLTTSALQTFETQKILQIAESSDMADEEKQRLFKENFDKLNNVSIGIVNDAVFKVETSEGSTDNPKFIKEFMSNVDKEIFKKIQTHIELMREQNQIKPLRVKPTQEMIDAGYSTEPLDIPLVFDASSFFV